MEEQVHLKLNRRTSNILVGKILLLLSFSLMIGYFMTKDDEEDYQAGKRLTKEAYMANYEAYKAELTGSEPTPRPVGYFIVAMLVFTFFGLYEFLGIVFSKIIDFVNKLAHPDIPQDNSRL